MIPITSMASKSHKRKRALDPGYSDSKFEVSSNMSLNLPPIKVNTDVASEKVTVDSVTRDSLNNMSPNFLPAINVTTDVIMQDSDISSSHMSQILPASKLHRNVATKKLPPVVAQQRSRREEDNAQDLCDPSAISSTPKEDRFWHMRGKVKHPPKVASPASWSRQQEDNMSQAPCDPSAVSPISPVPTQDRHRLLFQREDTAPIALLSHVNRRRRRYARALNGIESQRLASVHRHLDRARESTERRVTRQAEQLRKALAEIDAAEDNRRRKWTGSEDGALVSSLSQFKEVGSLD
jgi:hypothetical protein